MNHFTCFENGAYMLSSTHTHTHTYHIPDSISTNWSPSTRRHRMYIINKQMKNAPKQQQQQQRPREEREKSIDKMLK